MNMINKGGYTFVELMVTVSLIAILGTIGFVSINGNNSTARDSVRINDFAKIKLYLSNYKEKNGLYPLPANGFNITNNGKVVATQGKLSQKSLLNFFDSIPVDPSTKLPYIYSTLSNRSTYQIAATLEDDETPKTLLQGDYASVSKDILPSIILAIDSSPGTDIEINQSLAQGVINSKKFLFNNNTDNIPYKLDNSEGSISNNTDLNTLLAKVDGEDYWQNIDFQSCEEISEAGRYIGDGQYQILVNNVLTGTSCTIDADS